MKVFNLLKPQTSINCSESTLMNVQILIGLDHVMSINFPTKQIIHIQDLSSEKSKYNLTSRTTDPATDAQGRYQSFLC